MTEQHSQESPSILERIIFNNRLLILLICVMLTVFLGYRATSVKPDTRLEKLVPSTHEYVLNAKDFYAGSLDEGTSMLRVAVSVKEGDIFDYEYLTTLQKISDELSLVAGVDTGSLQSLWAAGMVWMAVSPEGFEAGPVIDYSTFDDSPETMEQIRANMLKAGIVGTYVSNDFKASMIDFMVLPNNTETKQPLNYSDFAKRIEAVRDKYQTDNLRIHVIGDVKKLSDLVEGFHKVLTFFAIAFAITAVLLFLYTRCWKATLMPLICSVVAVIWQVGVLNLLGSDLGVFSVLVPFLIFAIGVSHGVQIINGIAHEAAAGADSLGAAQIAFRHLHRPGLLALLSDGIGFAMLLVINIGAIQDLAKAASIGVALVIITNLVLLPIVMSYVGVTRSCIEHAQSKIDAKSLLWDTLGKFATRPGAIIAIILALITAGIGFYFGQDLKIGDLDKGAPELRADSRYNLDNTYITTNFSTSTDLMTVFVNTPEQQCQSYKTATLMDRLGWQLSMTEGVQSVSSPTVDSKGGRYFTNEGNIKFYALPRDERVLGNTMNMGALGYANSFDEVCDRKSMELQLADHKEETLQRVVGAIEAFEAENGDEDIRFSLGFGNAAFEAATNQVITKAQYQILLYVYGAVFIMCLLMFRSWRAVICILTPLALTSLMANGLMAQLGIGVKVATLPVIALGVGIGVDYGIYIFSRLISYINLGHPIAFAYTETLKTTGKAVFFTGCTLAVGVATWYFSPIKFQADMGILLTFMFLWNMLGALTLLPGLAYFLTKPENK